ncbi:MAG: PqqD family protein [Methanosarcina sp.]
MKLRKNIATSEAGLIFNPGTGDSFSVNSIGNDILSKLKENRSLEEIIDFVSAKYEVEKIQLERDLDDFISQLYDYNLLEKTN